MTTTDHPHTIDEALERFTLIGGNAGSPDKNTACAMTALSWVAGESWTDHPDCAHPILADLANRANDHGDTTPEQRAQIVRAGATGLIDTWWLPGEVVVACIAQAMLEAEAVVDRCLATLAWVTLWKESGRPRPYLRGADLRGAYLSGADLSGADLSVAYLRGADLSGADLSDAVGVASAPCNQLTVPPAGWTVNTTTWRLERVS